MATYIPNATQTTEPVESRTVESAALEFRTLKASINGRIADVQTQNNNQDVRIQAIEAALLAIGEGGLPGTVYVQRLSGTGVQTTFTLNVSVPVSALIDIFINGVYQQKDSFTVAGSLLSFSEAPPAGTNNIEVVISITIANVETDASLVSYSSTSGQPPDYTVEEKLREFMRGIGTPEGAVVAPVGTLYIRADGGVGTTLYVKEAGSGTVGWAAK